MLEPREKRRKLYLPPDGDKNIEHYYETLTIFSKLKQNFPDVYRHILGIIKAFIKDR
jgi:hypothetical protein